jgi:hypothetical protein
MWRPRFCGDDRTLVLLPVSFSAPKIYRGKFALATAVLTIGLQAANEAYYLRESVLTLAMLVPAIGAGALAVRLTPKPAPGRLRWSHRLATVILVAYQRF